MKTKLYQELASRIDAMARCENTEKHEWFKKSEDLINKIMETAPSGSGIDNGTTLDLDKSTGEKLIFIFGYHHMNEAGYYDGWSEHTLIVKPSLQFGIDIRITGQDRNDIKDYLYQVYEPWLNQEIEIIYNKETDNVSVQIA